MSLTSHTNSILKNVNQFFNTRECFALPYPYSVLIPESDTITTNEFVDAAYKIRLGILKYSEPKNMLNQNITGANVLCIL